MTEEDPKGAMARMLARGVCRGKETHEITSSADVRMRSDGYADCAKCYSATQQSRWVTKKKTPKPIVMTWCFRGLHWRVKSKKGCAECAKFSKEVRLLLQRNGNQVDVCAAKRHHLPDMMESVHCEVCKQAKGELVFSDAILMCGHTISYRSARAPELDDMLICDPCGRRLRRVIDNRINEEETRIARGHIPKPSSEDSLFSDAV